MIDVILRPWSKLYVAAAILLFAGASKAGAQEHNYSTDAINELNLQFRQEYADAREAKLSNIGPVIIVRGDNLVLIREGTRVVGSTVNSNYHDLKAMAHIPLAIYCVLENCDDGSLNDIQSQKLTNLERLISRIETNLETTFSDPTARSNQVALVNRCQAFIANALEDRRSTADELDHFIDELRPVIIENASLAAQIRIDNYHQQMELWHQELPEQDWERLYIVIPGAVMSRKNSLAVRYFAKLFQQPSEGGRVIYAESQYDESQDLQLLGTHLLDSRIGEAFFDDESRMKRDLLGPAANAYLDTLDFGAFR